MKSSSPAVTYMDLKNEIRDMRERYPSLKDSDLFVAWFLKCFVTESEEDAVHALTGGAKDKSLDAVFIDDPAKKVFIVQGKFRQKLEKAKEHRSDLMAFADLASVFTDKDAFAGYMENLDTAAAGKAEVAFKRMSQRGYSLQLYYVTTGGCSDALAKESERVARRAGKTVSLDVIAGKRILKLLSDYLDGVAPPIPLLELEIESGQGIDLSGVLKRYDGNLRIASWVFPVNVRHIADMYDQAGIRLFARNVRGFLGSTAINEDMETTLEKEPDLFWYYNNGITIICDKAEKLELSDRLVMRIVNPQVINGQQTTRTLHRKAARSSKASVLVRVISVPRDTEQESKRFDGLVSKIVAATNWQNAIRASDLMANDRRQIDLERNLRKRDYQYLRKRQSKSEARRHAGVRHRYIVKKEELAQASAACDMDPSIVRRGKEQLFEERYYSQVFPNADPNYYLPRYWLIHYIAYVARGYPERAYAKWVVTHFVWQVISQVLKTRQQRELFIRQNERENFPALYKMCNLAFKGALAFYRARRGAGEKAMDVSSFFQRRGLHKEFAAYWARNGGKYKTQFNAWMRKFTAHMRQLEKER